MSPGEAVTHGGSGVSCSGGSCLFRRPSELLDGLDGRRVYFVNSYRAAATAENDEWTLGTTHYNGDFISVRYQCNAMLPAVLLPAVYASLCKDAVL